MPDARRPIRRSVPIALTEAPWAGAPEIVRIQLLRFEIDHEVVLGDEVQPPAGLRHAHQFGERAIDVRNRLEHVAADHEVEDRIGKAELEDAAVFESVRGSQTTQLHACATSRWASMMSTPRTFAWGKHLRQPICDFAGAAAGVQHARVVGKAIALEERLLLRPDRLGLRRESADHRLIGHFPGLRIEIVSARQSACSRRSTKRPS